MEDRTRASGVQVKTPTHCTISLALTYSNITCTRVGFLGWQWYSLTGMLCPEAPLQVPFCVLSQLRRPLVDASLSLSW